MKELQFTLSGNVTMAEYEFEICKEYSCIYHVHKAQGDTYVMIDLDSIRRKDWNVGVASWTKDQLPAEVIAGIEERLQQEIDEEEFRVRVENEDSRVRRRA